MANCIYTKSDATEMKMLSAGMMVEVMERKEKKNKEKKKLPTAHGLLPRRLTLMRASPSRTRLLCAEAQTTRRQHPSDKKESESGG
jgi:hypothetical protein